MCAPLERDHSFASPACVVHASLTKLVRFSDLPYQIIEDYIQASALCRAIVQHFPPFERCMVSPLINVPAQP